MRRGPAEAGHTTGRLRAKDGGSAWESNPASPRKRGATDFEDREGHRAPFTSDVIVLADGAAAGAGDRAQNDCGFAANPQSSRPDFILRSVGRRRRAGPSENPQV